jgi:hypothetical protein
MNSVARLKPGDTVAFSGLQWDGACLNGRNFIVRETEEMTVALDEKQVGGTHYLTMPIQPWEVMQQVVSREEFIGFLKCSIIKYSMRAGHKVGADDDEAKCRHYMEKLDALQGIEW